MDTFEECRSDVGHLLAQNHPLQALLARAYAAALPMNRPDGDAALEHVAHILELVRTGLTQHFAAEEHSGGRKEVSSHCQKLSTDSERFLAEHAQLLVELDRLIAESKDGPDDVAARIAVERDLDEFCATLRAYEAAENALLQNRQDVPDVNGPH